MSSNAARKVAQEVLETIGKDKKSSVIKIAPKYGYSKTTAGSGQIQKTKSYKEVMFPVVQALERERNRIINELANKDLSKERYHDLIDGLDKITKNVQLLSGKSTENINVIPILNEFVQECNSDKEDSTTS
jgi:hypothetical protein